MCSRHYVTAMSYVTPLRSCSDEIHGNIWNIINDGRSASIDKLMLNLAASHSIHCNVYIAHCKLIWQIK